jgi:hypothetical protein
MFLRSARHMAIPGTSTNDRERFIVRAHEKLTAFLELESGDSSFARPFSESFLNFRKTSFL